MSNDRYVSPLSERYASREMQYIFSPDKKFRTWRRLWIALAETEKELGLNITDEQIEELANDFQVNNADTRLMKVLSEYFKDKPSEEDKKQIIADSLMKINNATKNLYDRNQRLCGFLKTRVYDYDNSSMYDTAMKEFSLYNKEEDKEQK